MSLALRAAPGYLGLPVNHAKSGKRGSPQVTIDFLVSKTASGTPAVGPYTPSQSALSHDVSHAFTEVTGWESDTPILKPLPLAGV
jgi:hypothetical protein